jgi:cell division protease FtsH
MVGLWGMSDELGPVSYSIGETHPFLGRELGMPREYAEATATELDRAVRGLIEEAHRRAYDALLAHRPALDALAAELLAHETVEGHQLDALLAASDGAAATPAREELKVAAALSASDHTFTSH